MVWIGWSEKNLKEGFTVRFSEAQFVESYKLKATSTPSTLGIVDQLQYGTRNIIYLIKLKKYFMTCG